MTRLLPVATMLILMVGGLITSVSSIQAIRPGPPPSLSSLADGDWTRGLEEAFEQDMIIREPSIHLFNALIYRVFGEARSGALVGAAGWLFSTEEFSWSGQSETNLAVATQTISQVVSRLKARGASVTLAFVPSKADILRDQLGRHALPQAAATLYQDVLSAASTSGADSVPDLAAALRDALPGKEVFLHTDTHWSVAGAGQAAVAICQGLAMPAEQPTFTAVIQPSLAHRGDLLNFLELGPFNHLIPVREDTIARIVSTRDMAETDALDALFGDPVDGGPAIDLVGTSYSANALWSFGDQIKLACQAEVIGFATDGEGPFEPMANYLAKLEAGEIPMSPVIIWEMPVRYLDDYSANELAALF